MTRVLIYRSLAFAFLLTFCAPVECLLHAQRDYKPFFSTLATYVYHGQPARSPDGKKILTAKEFEGSDDFPLDIVVTTDHGNLSARINFGLNAQALWSPDSSAFAITGSLEGANGLYETEVFYIRDGLLERVSLTELVQETFGHPVKCGWPEHPNVEAVKWIGKRGQLLVAAQIIAHSNCDSLGTFKAYVVDMTTRRIVHEYDQIQAKEKFGNVLGSWLRDADDSCIRNPSSCYVAANHPELKSKSEK